MILRRADATSQLARRQACDADPSCMSKDEFVEARDGELPVRLSTLKSVDTEITYLPSLSVFNDAFQVHPVCVPALLSGGSAVAPQGFNNRVSSRIRLVGTRFRITFFPYEGMATPVNMYAGPSTARVVLFYDRAPASSTTTFSTVFSAFQENGTEYYTPFCSQNPVKTSRFLVLHDEMVSLPSLTLVASVGRPFQALISGDTMNLNLDRFVDLTGLESRFQDTGDGTGQVAACTEGLVSLIVISDTLPDGMWNAFANVRSLFYD